MINLAKIVAIFKKPNKLFWLIPIEILNCLPDKTFIKLTYHVRMGKTLNLNSPKSFNEKLQWLKLYDRNPFYTQLVDKYEVRKYIAKIMGEEYLIPLLGVYNNVDDIDFDKLPNQFVLKCTHDSGGIVICKDKSLLNMRAAKNKLAKALKRNYYYLGREWPYKNVRPRIICEQYMVDESGYELKDYKIFCFDGLPRIIQVDFDRFTKHKRNLYDTNWNLLNYEILYPRDINHIIPKPENLNDMLNLASLLSKNIPFLRVDFYIIKNEIYFGELTFYPGDGSEEFTPEYYDELLGSWITLPKSKSMISR